MLSLKTLPEISVVVPVRNEEDNISDLIQEIHSALSGTHFELIYVDDGSDDQTQARLLENSAPWLRVLRHQESCGQSTALWTGVKAARSHYIVTLDGDGQNDPADIPVLLSIARLDTSHGPLLVIGWRKDRHDHWLRRVSSRVANAVRGRMLRDHTPDTGCSLKVFSREAFLALPYFDHMHRFLPALFLRSGGRVQSVPVHHRPRTKGTSKYGVGNRLWVGIVDLLGVRWLLARAKLPIIQELPMARETNDR
ncbi:Dolichol-phosphate mannosyltransferase [Gammaproteobacteria bacterium]